MANEVLLVPDVELWLCTYLRDRLAASGQPYASGVVVSISVPDPVPPRLVVVRRDGGARLDIVRESARFGVQVWAETDKDATDLAGLTLGLILASPDGMPVLSASQMSGASSVAEPNPGRRKRYATVELIVRCAALV